ncbi:MULTISPECIES: CCRG-2 family RiPP [unclassified Prochlorococcus]|uniref:CCRG-2 family RiPP n=1 Tax=unclassified Prochlorococcus TaxID=2627481 RepID=UPI0039A6414F
MCLSYAAGHIKLLTNQELTIAQLQIIVGGGLASSQVGQKMTLNLCEICDVGTSLRQTREMAPVIERAVAVPAFL